MAGLQTLQRFQSAPRAGCIRLAGSGDQSTVLAEQIRTRIAAHSNIEVRLGRNVLHAKRARGLKSPRRARMALPQKHSIRSSTRSGTDALRLTQRWVQAEPPVAAPIKIWRQPDAAGRT